MPSETSLLNFTAMDLRSVRLPYFFGNKFTFAKLNKKFAWVKVWIEGWSDVSGVLRFETAV
jgi:hypothetical protein